MGNDLCVNKREDENQLEPAQEEQPVSPEEHTSENEAADVKHEEKISSEEIEYSNIEDVQGAVVSQENPQMQERGVLGEGEDKENVYETISPAATGPSHSAPPAKPLPYSVSKKVKSGASAGQKLAETEKVQCRSNVS